ncbi:MAG: SBBP repeat-containing protein [Desulfobacteraceae bacterium]|nr:SBBP repeat-containing protein [Desulfobacteraceae bacterium]
MSGLFFTSGIAFNRIENGRSAIFIARYIDNNTQAMGDMDSIKYLGVNIIDEGTSGQFADKPWIAIDAPSNSSDPVQIEYPGLENQPIPRFNVYIVYSIFLGDSPSGDHSKIMFARSTDCGKSFGKSIKLSESVHVCQGTNIAVSPKDGTIYVVWRQYAREQQGVPHAIVMCKSEDSGQTFTKATVVAEIDPFDQFTGAKRFRTSAFPALAVDHYGLIYLAWSQRGEGPNDEARIVIKTSIDGKKWSTQEPVDDHEGGGHQIMPSLTCAGGKLTITWYDTRKSLGYIDEGGNYIYDPENPEIADPGPTGIPHTIDAWVAQAGLSNPSSDPPANPVFTDSTQVSRYLYEVETDSEGHVTNPPVVYQAQFSFPNFPIFMEGEAPFMGDYIDITPAPMFLYDDLASWRFNTGEGAFDPTLSYITFACNRDVIPPREGFYWTDYWPPGSDACDDWTAGLRNQNIYSAPVTHGIQVGCPVNTKPLEEYRRSFLVFVKNLTDEDKLIRLTIDAPNLDASFWESDTPPEEEYPFMRCESRIVEVYVFPHSSITLTVFVQPYSLNPLEIFRVNVEEIIDVPDGTPIIGLQSSIVLNPDPVNTKLIPPLAVEDHTPLLISEDPADVDLSDATMLSAPIVYSSYLEELLDSSNPDIAAPGLRHPGLRHDTIINPGLRHSTLGNVPEGEVTDLRWKVTNVSSTTSAYSFEAIAETPPVPHQLLIYRVATTPISAEQCQLRAEEHHELLLSVENPGLRHPGLRHPGLRHPGLRHNTFFLAPGETAICTLRLIDPDPPQESVESTQEAAIMNNGETQDDFVPVDYATTVAGAAIPQATNEHGIIDFKSSLYIIADVLPAGSVGDPFTVILEAYGGEPAFIIDKSTQDPNDDVWKYDEWSLRLQLGESLPPGFDLTSLSPNGILSGTPQYDPDATYPQDYFFTVEVKDDGIPQEEVEEGDIPQQTARRKFKITIDCEIHITAEAGEIVGGEEIIYFGGDEEDGYISPAGDVPVRCGFDETFEIGVTDPCYYLAYVQVDEDIFTEPTNTDTYEFIQVEANPDVYTFKFKDVQGDPHSIKAIFARIPFTITATATEGGSINPLGTVTVYCGLNQTFIIEPDDGFRVLYVIVDRDTENPIYLDAVTEYTFTNVLTDHTIHAAFGWIRRYNNDSVNGNDEPSDIAVNDSGNVYVTGYSLGSPTGNDYYTIGYNSFGTEVLKARYDGPAHEGDKANAIAVDNDGNVYVTGFSHRGIPHKHSDYCTVKYDSSGNEAWDVRYDARRNGEDVATAITLDQSGNYVYITGRSQDSESKKSDALHYDYYTIKYNANTGRIESGWGARYNNASVNGDDEATAIAVDFAGNVYVTGRSEQILGSTERIYDYATVKYFPNGNMDMSWGENGVVRYDGGNNDEATAIAVDSAGNVYVTGRSTRTNIDSIDFDYATVMYDINGDEKQVARYNNASVDGDDEATAIAVDDDGNVHVTGKSHGGGTGFDYGTIKYSPAGNGDTTWVSNGVVRYDGGNGDDAATAMALDTSGNVYVTGKSQGDGTGFDYCTIKYDSSTGNVVWIDRYNNYPVNGDDVATAIAVDISSGIVYVTGRSKGNGTRFDFATVQIKQ